MLSINAASAALMISGIPFEGPIRLRASPSPLTVSGRHTRRRESDASVFELVVAGREDGDVAIMMVEAGGTAKSFAYYGEGTKKVDAAVLDLRTGHVEDSIKESIQLQRQLVARVIATHGPIEPLPFSRSPTSAPTCSMTSSGSPPTMWRRV